MLKGKVELELILDTYWLFSTINETYVCGALLGLIVETPPLHFKQGV